MTLVDWDWNQADHAQKRMKMKAECREFNMTAVEFTDRLEEVFVTIDESSLKTTDSLVSGDYGCAVVDKTTDEVIGVAMFAGIDGESLTYNQSKTIDISLVTLMVYSADDVGRILLGTILTLDPSLQLKEALEVGACAMAYGAAGSEFVYHGITYLFEIDGDDAIIWIRAKS